MVSDTNFKGAFKNHKNKVEDDVKNEDDPENEGYSKHKVGPNTKMKAAIKRKTKVG